MSLVYISGALTTGSGIENIKKFYEAIGDLCIEKEMQVYIPHKHTDPVQHADVLPQEVYLKDVRQVSKSDLVIAYVGMPSLGVGLK